MTNPIKFCFSPKHFRQELAAHIDATARGAGTGLGAGVGSAGRAGLAGGVGSCATAVVIAATNMLMASVMRFIALS